jgi:carboxyl-terminal processing protease
LKELSANRIKASKDFSYVIEDVMKAKDRIKANRLSVNKKEREKELAESDTLQKERNAERRTRFAKTVDEDKKSLKFYKLTLDDLASGGAVRPYDPSEENADFMRRAKDETEDLDETPKWPTGLDPLKRESLYVLRDLVEFTEKAKLDEALKDAAKVR